MGKMPSSRLLLAAGGSLAALALTAGCGALGSTPTPSVSPTSTPTVATPTVTPSDTATPTESGTPTASPAETTSTPPAPTTPIAPKATGTGSMLLYSNPVSDKFVTTCATVGGEPTITMTDHSNDFFTKVDVTIVLKAGASEVATLAAEFGEDSEGVVRKLSFPPGSAKLTVRGATYRVTGKAMMYEDGKASQLTPFTISATCPAAF